MVGACINVAQSTDHNSVWHGREPVGFETEFSQLLTEYGDITARAAGVVAHKVGSTEAKAAAETALADAAYLLARALTVHFTQSGDVERRSEVDFTRKQFTEVRSRDLLDRANAIRSLAAATLGEPNAEGVGISDERLAALTTAIAEYSRLIDLPRGQMANRNTQRKGIEEDTLGLVERTHRLDDLILQFDGTPEGRQFIEAWRRARVIVDAGTGHGAGGIPAAAPASADPASGIQHPATVIA
jgi:hypothetical protein